MKGCERDTDGDGNCPIHPDGCRCLVPDCNEIVVYSGLCEPHADDEFGDPNPTVEELVGPL